MNVTLGLIADSANVSQEGKLNLLGIFDTIFAFNFPCKHSQMTLVTKIQADVRDNHHLDRNLKIILVDENAHELLAINATFNFKNTPPGERGTTSSIIGLTDLVFEKPGNYAFKILINGEEKSEIPLKLHEAQKKA